MNDLAESGMVGTTMIMMMMMMVLETQDILQFILVTHKLGKC